MFFESSIHPISLALTLIVGFLLIVLPRRATFFPFIATAILIPLAQQIIVFGFHFPLLRILLLLGWIRVLIRADYRTMELNTIDKAVILWAIIMVLTYTINWQTTDALTYRLGLAYDLIGIYFIFRFFVRDFTDADVIFKSFAVTSITLSIFMLIEFTTQKNIFYIFGGVPEMTTIREGSLRCQGPFIHPIMAGSFAASLTPIFLFYLLQVNKSKTIWMLGITASIMIVIFAASSGPVLTLIAGMLGLGMWHFRPYLKIVRWSIVPLLIMLQIFMKAPVWALIARSSVVDGSTGYHRFLLIDNFIRRFDEWFLVGTTSTAEWGDGLGDVTNHYIRIAVDGGLITLVIFILIITFCFRGIGQGLKAWGNDKSKQLFLWSLGSSLFSHVVNFMGVSYFDQINFLWYALLSIIATVAIEPKEKLVSI